MALVMPRISLLASSTHYIQRFRAVLLHIAGLCAEAEGFAATRLNFTPLGVPRCAHDLSRSNGLCGDCTPCDETTAVETQVLSPQRVAPKSCLTRKQRRVTHGRRHIACRQTRELWRFLVSAHDHDLQRLRRDGGEGEGEFTWHKHDDTDDFFLVL